MKNKAIIYSFPRPPEYLVTVMEGGRDGTSAYVSVKEKESGQVQG